MRGVQIETVALSVAGTDARTSGYGELSGGFSSLYSTLSSSSDSSALLPLVSVESIFPCTDVANDALESMPMPIPPSERLVELRRSLLKPCDRLRRLECDLRSGLPLVPCSDCMVFPCLIFLRLLSSGISLSLPELESESCGSCLTGTAPYEPVPKAGEDRMRSGAFDMMLLSMVVHHTRSVDAIEVS